MENLDKTKEELLVRLQSTSKEKSSEEQDKQVLLNDIAAYKRDLLQRE